MLWQLATIIRYRFMLFAGLLPYLLGSAVGYSTTKSFEFLYFLIGLGGLAGALLGVECFNEYFDSRLGSDRVFSLEKEAIPHQVFKLGIFAFAVAGLCALYLTLVRGLPVLLLALFGFFVAVFYVGPPLRLAYRGFGELAVSLAYGPFLCTGGYYLQSGSIDAEPFLSSVAPALLILAILAANEIPDYYGDRLVGKRNIVVRLGQQNTVRFYVAVISAVFIVIGMGVVLSIYPMGVGLIFLALPLVAQLFLLARRHYEYPLRFIPVIRGTVLLYIITVLVLLTAYLTK